MTDNLFAQFDSCSTCPKYEFINDENRDEVVTHLASNHKGVGLDAYVLANRPDERDRLQKIYNEAKGYLDNDFANRFVSEIDNLSWELTVYKHLRDSGIKINSNQSTGPDFDTEIGYIECVCVGRGAAQNAIPLPKAAVIDGDGNIKGEINFEPVPVNEMKLRVSSGYQEKQRKYINYVNNGIINPQSPRIIAINWYCEGASWMTGRRSAQNDPAVQCIFGFGNLEVTFDTETGNIISSQLSQAPTVPKFNGEEIEVGYFNREVSSDSERIDGVILSNVRPTSLDLSSTRSINNPKSDTNFEIERLSTTAQHRASVNPESSMIDLTQIN